MTAIDDFDYTIIHFLNQFARRSELADTLAYDVADASILKGGIFMAYLWWLWYSANDRNAIHRESIVLIVIGGFVAAVLSRVLQLALPFHDRPLHTAGLGFVLPYGVEPQTLEFWSSFPSDHAVLFGALSAGIYFLSARVGLVAWAWTLIVISLPRIYLGYHFPSDVIAGAIFGWAVMHATKGLLAKSRLSVRIARQAVTHPAQFYCAAFVITYEIAVLLYDVRHLALDSLQILKSLALSDIVA